MMRTPAILCGLACAICAVPAGASRSGWRQVSNVGRDLLFVSALALPAIHADWTGDLQAAGSIAAGGVAAYALKRTFPEERPDHSDRRSFPSGHSTEAFAAAATLENRYGWQAGLPAFAVASVVAVARVEAHKHHWYDCVAGAALGTGTGFLLTSRRSDHVKLVPWADGAGGGVSLLARF